MRAGRPTREAVFPFPECPTGAAARTHAPLRRWHRARRQSARSVPFRSAPTPWLRATALLV